MKLTQPNVTHYQQEEDEQCWAACMKMMLDQKRRKDDSPKVKNEVVLVSYDAIISRTMHDQANSPIYSKMIPSAFYTFGIDVSSENNKLSWETIKESIDKNTPIMIGVQWQEGGGHVMVIGGYEEDEPQRWVYLYDPYEGQAQKVHYDRLINGNYEYAGRNSNDEWSLSIQLTGEIKPNV